jgi:hypothetical protein
MDVQADASTGSTYAKWLMKMNMGNFCIAYRFLYNFPFALFIFN